MKKIKHLIVFLVIFLLIGCGVDINYNVDVDTNKRSMKIDILLKVQESDYEKISGGKEKIISIIQEQKPKDIEFSIDENTGDLKFILEFNSYEDYKSKFKSITGTESESVFKVEEFSSKSPFVAYQDIQLEDSLSDLLNWLKTALVNSGTISAEDAEKMIRQEQYRYKFNDKDTLYTYGENEYQERSLLDITLNKINIVIKKDGLIDFDVDVIIEKAKLGDFTDNFNKFLKNKKVDINYEKKEITYHEKKCMNYSIKIKDIDLNDSKSFEQINTVFGNNFSTFEVKNEESSSLLKNEFDQSLNIRFDFMEFFNRENIDPVNITVDLDGVKLNSEKMEGKDIKIPYETSTLDNGGQFYLPLHTTYSSFKYYVLIIFLILIGSGVLLLKKFGPKKLVHNILEFMNPAIDKFRRLMMVNTFEKEFEIQDSLIIGKDFIIQVSNIGKIDYGKRLDIGESIIKWFGVCLLCIPIFRFGQESLAIILLIISLLPIYSLIIKYRLKALNIELVSGKIYSFVFEEETKAIEMYEKISDLMEMEEQKDMDMELITKIVERVEGEEDEEA